MKQTDHERFWSYVEKTEGCWLWKGCVSVRGFGRFGFKGKTVMAHRFAYVERYGAIPAGKQINHICRVNNCVNPFHLRAATHRTCMVEHSSGAAAVNVQKVICKHGHALQGNNLIISFARCGTLARNCRVCAKIYMKAWHAAHYTKKGNFHARKTHCKHGHPLSGENLRIRIKKGRAFRVCIQCARLLDRARYEKRREKGRAYHREYMRKYRHQKISLPGASSEYTPSGANEMNI